MRPTFFGHLKVADRCRSFPPRQLFSKPHASPDILTGSHIRLSFWTLNPQENLWDEIREKLFKNYALRSIRGGLRKA
jgi:hypothetical protein